MITQSINRVAASLIGYGIALRRTSKAVSELNYQLRLGTCRIRTGIRPKHTRTRKKQRLTRLQRRQKRQRR